MRELAKAVEFLTICATPQELAKSIQSVLNGNPDNDDVSVLESFCELFD